jgi:hypothetical protein
MKSLYDWQIECLESIGLQETGGKATSMVAANGSGKTSNLVAPAVRLFLSRYPRGQVVVTSGSFCQVEKQHWPAMKVFQSRFPEWGFLNTELKTPEGGLALRSPDRADAALGCIMCGLHLSGAITGDDAENSTGSPDFAPGM